MIVPKEPLTWLQLVFRWQGTALVSIRWRMFGVFSLALALTVYDELGGIKFGLTIVPFSLVGVALGIFLGFRNSASYDRFWEGRKLWGLLVNTTRSFARQSLTLLQPTTTDDETDCRTTQEGIVKRTIAFVHAFRQHLRGGARLDELDDYLSAQERERCAADPNPPIALLFSIGEMLAEARRRGWIHPYHQGLMEETLSKLTDIQGACERIKNTPVPFSYSVLIHRIVGVYCFALPFALFETMGLLTPVVTVFVAYGFLGIDAVGNELEEPFGTDPNDLPLSTISRIIERDLKARIGLPVPEPLQPVNEVLS